MSILLEATGLSKRYGEQKAVDAVTFTLDAYTSTALIGPNGAGKTTTLSMLAGLVTQTEGSIAFEGSSDRESRSHIGFLPQYPKFFPWLTAIEFTEMAAKISGMSAREARAESQKTLEFVGLGDALNKRTGTFSGGMKQRLGLAQAIVHKPKLLLLDEPVSALDPVGRRQIMNLLKELQQQTTILYSTHILNDAEEMTDQLLFMQHGKLIDQGSLDDFRQRYAEPKIRIEFEGTDELLRFVQTAPWQVEATGSIGWIDLSVENSSMQDVLALLSTGRYGVRKVERQSASLEEIFMKVVQ
ncbi:ABC-2 type transport system ATP-binding protein [Sporosarcina luteola]|nr:ABC-2 type transport system ATP-binding protein [Sporosarcina luteola]